MAKKAKTKKNSKFYKIVSFILIVTTIISGGFLVYFDVLPLKYLLIGAVIILGIVLLIVYKLNAKTNLFTKLLCILLSLIIMFIEGLGIIYSYGTIEFFNNIIDTGYRNETYSLYVLEERQINNYKDLKGLTIGYKSDEEGNTKALNKLNNKIKYTSNEYDSITELVTELNDKKIDAIYINEAIMNVYLDEHEKEHLKPIGSFDITIKNNSDFKTVNITKKPFVLYLSGVDTSGNVYKSTRSDVNILAVVNPQKGKILLLNTPRDYYVTLEGKNTKDKLTHAGIYGIEESAKTLGLLYDTEVNYYAKINFTSFIKIIDNLGGITIDVDKPDYRYNGSHDCGYGYICEQNSKRLWDSSTIYIKYGKNIKLNGEQALAYTRNRHQFASGDNARGLHQQQVIKGIIEKAMSAKTITKYNTILKDLSKGIITNIDQKTITKFINYQLDNNIKWEISTYSVKGKDGFEKCYSLGNAKAYVLVPEEETIEQAKDLIKEIIE